MVNTDIKTHQTVIFKPFNRNLLVSVEFLSLNLSVVCVCSAVLTEISIIAHILGKGMPYVMDKNVKIALSKIAF